MELIFGAGGHGRVVLDALRLLGREPDGFIDDNEQLTDVSGLPVYRRSMLTDGSGAVVYHGIGRIDIRREAGAFLRSLGIEAASVIHPMAVVSPDAVVDAGSVILAGAIVNTGAHLGEGVIINSGAIVEHDCKVGAWAHLSPNSCIGGAANVGESAWIGLGSSVLHEKSVGANSILGAGSVATTDIPENVTAVGVPARVIKQIGTP